MNKMNNKSGIPQILKHKNERLSNDPDIANAFCEFFTNIGPEYANKIPQAPKTPQQYLKNNIRNSIFLNPTDPEEVAKLIQNLKSKNSSGHDNITSKLLKHLNDELKSPICDLINKSINSGIFPDVYKLAEVVPIYKSKNKEETNNYRPISLLPTISKILEKIIHKRVYKFLQKNKILYDSQYGFRPNHSTNDAITELVADVTKSFEDKNNTLSIFLDLSKAFDTIDHTILLHKLNHYGIRGTSLNWFKSYLENRKQYVKINNHKSNTKNVICGVPQGSVLGPLLFILYINDLPNSLSHTHAIIFADDTTIYSESKCINTLYNNINTDLMSLSDWFKSNKLSLNISKTNYMLFTNNVTNEAALNKLRLTIGTEEIEKKHNIKFLGIIIDDKLNWQKHIEYTKNKISGTTYVLKMVKNVLPYQNMKTLYNSLIQPYLEYGIINWGGTHENHLNKLRVQQKKTIRMITRSKYNEHTKPIFKQLNILDLNKLYLHKMVQFMYKINNNLLPSPVVKIYKHNYELHLHNTRQHNQPHIQHRRTQLASKQITHTGPDIWHNLPLNFKQSNSVKILKKTYKKYLIEN